MQAVHSLITLGGLHALLWKKPAGHFSKHRLLGRQNLLLALKHAAISTSTGPHGGLHWMQTGFENAEHSPYT